MGKAVAMKGKAVDIDQRDEEIWRLRKEGARFSKIAWIPLQSGREDDRYEIPELF